MMSHKWVRITDLCKKDHRKLAVNRWLSPGPHGDNVEANFTWSHNFLEFTSPSPQLSSFPLLVYMSMNHADGRSLTSEGTYFIAFLEKKISVRITWPGNCGGGQGGGADCKVQVPRMPEAERLASILNFTIINQAVLLMLLLLLLLLCGSEGLLLLSCSNYHACGNLRGLT